MHTIILCWLSLLALGACHKSIEKKDQKIVEQSLISRRLVSLSIAGANGQPVTATLTVGQTQPLTATAHYSEGEDQEKAPVQWSVIPAELATISSDGVLTPVHAGKVQVIATLEQVSQSVAVEIVEPVPLTNFVISDPGPLAIDAPVQLKATGAHAGVTSDIVATWSLVNPTEGVQLSADGQFRASVAGVFTVQAQAEGLTIKFDLTVRDRSLNYTESQFWVYEFSRDRLKFNDPWDKEDGDAIIHDVNDPKVPEFAKSCFKKSQEALNAALMKDAIAKRVGDLLKQKATSDVTILVNVLPTAEAKENLKRRDRDAYFWQSNSLKERPTFSMNKFNVGQWVWEVIAYPDEGCDQPSETDMIRYLDYAASRLAKR